MRHSPENRQLGVVGRKALAEHEATRAAKSAESFRQLCPGLFPRDY
jgi:hypothetical protein